MRRCKRCVLPQTRPDTHFVEGVCSACLSFDKRKTIDWAARRRALEQILEAARNPSGYDCIVASSGGKDSHYIALTLIEMGARPLIVTATTCHLTDIGRRNIDNLARYATTIEVSPNKTMRAKLNRLGLELVGDISWPEHVSIFTVPLNMANELGIPIVFYGENPQEAYGGPPGADEALELTRRWRSEFGGFLGLRPDDLVGKAGITARDIVDYKIAEPMGEIRAYFLGQFIEWDSHRNADMAIKAGMQYQLPTHANVWDAENLDNAMTGIHDYGMYLKYGYGRGCAQASVDIRAGLIDRAQALRFVQAKDGLFPEIYAGVSLATILEKISMTREELMRAMDRFTNKELFRRVMDDASAPMIPIF